MNSSPISYLALLQFLDQLFLSSGLNSSKSFSLAKILLEGELLGHKTHGLALVKPYFEELEKGNMEIEKDYEVLNFTSTTQLWNGNYAPGTWLTEEAISVAAQMAISEGIGTIVIQKSHHIACLAAYLEEVAKNKLMLIVSCSDPRNATVAPFGGLTGLYSPNPLAIGIPTETEPILIDVSMSATANGVVANAAKNNQMLGGYWLMDSNGNPTNDPKRFFEETGTTVLPLGGTDLGYKGFALGIMIEAMTNALGGYGRSENPNRWGASVFVQVINPEKFAGENLFLKEMQSFKDKASASKPISSGVRMPGERGMKLKYQQIENGINIESDLLNELKGLGALRNIYLNN
jgi:LDH2 family malate/lactate/ureidoglycolate dehydrogenase